MAWAARMGAKDRPRSRESSKIAPLRSRLGLESFEIREIGGVIIRCGAGAPAPHRMITPPISRISNDSNPSRDRKGAILLLSLLLGLSFAPILAAQAIPYSRPVETAPQQDTIGGGYKTPAVQKPLPRDALFQVLDVL